MDNEKRRVINELANEILEKKSSEYSQAEMIIIIQSQYINIGEFYMYGKSLNDNDDLLKVCLKIKEFCEAFFTNLDLISENARWKDSDKHISDVRRIANDINDVIKVHNGGNQFK